jgi:hypothetical protein
MRGEQNGFFGKHHSHETRAKFRERNRVYVHNSTSFICVKKEEVDAYIAQGWMRGRGQLKRQDVS